MRTRVGSAAAALLAMVLMLPTTEAQVDQQTMAKQLLGQDVKQRNEAFERAQLLRPANMTAELRAALITLFERENDLVGQAYKHGEVLANLEDPEFIARVSRVVAELRDPSAIPALSVAIYGGLTVMRALADFGEPAAPAVRSVMMAPDSMPEAVNDGLIALRFMVEGANEHPLAPATLAEICRAARQRLATGKGVYVTTLWWAIDLAVAVDDPRAPGRRDELGVRSRRTDRARRDRSRTDREDTEVRVRSPRGDSSAPAAPPRIDRALAAAVRDLEQR